MNCHKRCESVVPNLCGINQKLLAEAVAQSKVSITFDLGLVYTEKNVSSLTFTRTLWPSTQGHLWLWVVAERVWKKANWFFHWFFHWCHPLSCNLQWCTFAAILTCPAFQIQLNFPGIEFWMTEKQKFTVSWLCPPKNVASRTFTSHITVQWRQSSLLTNFSPCPR